MRGDPETVLSGIYSFSRESFLERAVNHLRPQCTRVYKKRNLINAVLCGLGNEV